METLTALNIVLNESLDPALVELRDALEACQRERDALALELLATKIAHHETKLKLSRMRERATFWEVTANLFRTKWT
jgi:hypothetical protein